MAPRVSLAAWAREQAPCAGLTASDRDVDAPRVRAACELVRAFIAERGLVVYGGQAIDYALRLAGSGLYPEGQLPDYDVYSPDSVGDAYDLADRLRAAGFAKVGALGAIHVTTMRVKTDSVFVADLSYAPPAVFRALPRLSFRGLSVLHPHFQRAAMHLAFCFPFNAPPREDVLSRFAQVLPRLELFEEFYPIKAEGPVALGGAAPAAVRVEVPLDRVALHGFAAYGLLRGALEALRSKCPRPPPLPPGLPSLDVALEPTGLGMARVSFAPPGGGLSVATPWPEDLLAGRAPPQKTPPYLELRPETWAFADGVSAHVTSGRLLAVVALRPSEDGPRVLVVSPQYLLLFFLAGALLAEGAWRSSCAAHYRATLDLVHCGAACLELLAPPEGACERQCRAFARLVARSPFGLPTQTLGDSNRGPALRRILGRLAKACGDDGPDLGAGSFPRGYHPPGRRPPPYDYADAPPEFSLDGGGQTAGSSLLY